MTTKEKMEEIHSKTDRGLDVFKQLIKTPFELDEQVTVNESTKFKVFFHLGYDNYVLSLWLKDDYGWEKNNYNIFHWVKENWGLRDYESAVNYILNNVLKPKESNSKPSLDVISKQIKEDIG